MGIEELILTTERKKREQEIILNMIHKNFTDEMIAGITEVSLEYVQKIRKSLAGS
jgi:hypothetical protein